MSATTRTDVHRPAEFDPADYEVIDYLDMKRPELPPGLTSEQYAAFTEYLERWQARILEHFPDWRTGGTDHQSVFQCNHCGHQGLRWVAVVRHEPTGAKLAFGEICADRVGLPGRDAFRAKFIKDRAALEQAALENRLRKEAFAAAEPEIVAFLNDVRFGEGCHNEFLRSVAAQLDRKGELSEAQVGAVKKFMAREAEQAAKRAAEAEALKDAGPLETGRRTVEGEVLSTRYQESDFGGAWKWLVRQDDGNKVWGSIPGSVIDLTLDTSYYDENGNLCVEQSQVDGVEGLRGCRVRFTAAVERSRDDEHFGFYKRPTKAALLAGAAS